MENPISTLHKLPTYYVPHGGGPCFDIEWPEPLAAGIAQLGAWLRQFGDSIGCRPMAVLVITAHWETPEFVVSTNPKPPMLYDYSGFPPHTYQLKYDAPGLPELAQQVQGLLAQAGIPVTVDATRGFDHGTFVPFRLIYPQADIPIVQLSIKQNMDPAAHLALGQALAPLREQGILIVGSGMSFHNFSTFMRPEGAIDSAAFDHWLTEVVEAVPAVRDRQLAQWDQLPVGRKAHPREDHLIPLMVVAGAAGEDVGKRIFSGEVMGTTVSAYQFGSLDRA